MSCVMVVRLHGHPDHQQGLGEPIVLKVYYRRFSKKKTQRTPPNFTVEQRAGGIVSPVYL